MESRRYSPETPPLLREEKISIFTLRKPLADALFLTTVAHELRRRSPAARIEVYSHWPELFQNNGDVASSRPLREPGVPPGHSIEYQEPWPPPRGRHILRTICDRLGIGGDDMETRTYYYPTEQERRLAREMSLPNGKPLVVIHPFSSFFAPRTKQWDFGNWKSFLELLPRDIETLRFCNPDEPATPTERPFHRDIQTTDIRLMVALLEQAQVFVGHDSGLAHLARALEKPSVVIFTGYAAPDVFGYPENLNLVPDLPYAPCWQGDGCEQCRGEICTKSITPEEVLDALLEALQWKE